MWKYNTWEKDLSDSVIALESIKNTVLPRLIKGKIHTIESSNNEILMLLDQKCGIDYIREDEEGMQGIAARVQWGDKAWNTFTIRSKRKSGAETELEKRLNQIENGYFYPAFTLQAYFNNRKENILKSIAIIRTDDLYRLYVDNQGLFHKQHSDNEFVFIRWSDIQKYIRFLEF